MIPEAHHRALDLQAKPCKHPWSCFSPGRCLAPLEQRHRHRGLHLSLHIVRYVYRGYRQSTSSVSWCQIELCATRTGVLGARFVNYIIFLCAYRPTPSTILPGAPLRKKKMMPKSPIPICEQTPSQQHQKEGCNLTPKYRKLSSHSPLKKMQPSKPENPLPLNPLASPPDWRHSVAYSTRSKSKRY